MTSAAFQTEMARGQDSHPKTKVEYIDLADVTTDISVYYIEGARFQQGKERAPDEMQAGDFDIVLNNATGYFSEFLPGSLFYTVKYHNARIRISQGFVLPDGTEEYEQQATAYIDELVADPDQSLVTLRCRDKLRNLLDRIIHRRPTTEVATAGGGNTGNGSCSAIETKPFKTKNELWTLTCTLGGIDGVATFSVIGATSGNVGTATSGTEFSTGTGAGGVRFTLTAGGTAWLIGDVFTFTTKQYPEWSAVNAGKIIWSILTGYNWDTDTVEAWSAQVLSFDHTKSTANTDLDYTAFSDAISDINTIGNFSLTGRIPYDSLASDVIRKLVLLFLGSMFTNADGRISIKVYLPDTDPSATAAFSDALKNTRCGYDRSIEEVINYVSIAYKKTNVWEFSNDEVNYDGNWVELNQDSIDDNDFLTQGYSIDWYAANGLHVQDLASKIVGKYGDPPLNIDFTTGMDALLTNVGDIVTVTDTKHNLVATKGEVIKMLREFDTQPAHITLRVRRDGDLNQTYGHLGSRVAEGDGLSPQATTYASASTTDKNFCYLGALDNQIPAYLMF